MLTRGLVKEVRQKIDVVLREHFEKTMFVCELGNASFTANTINFKFTVMVRDEKGNVERTEARDFKRNCTWFGLKEEHLGKIFKYSGEDKKLIGMMPRRRKHVNKK